jgi:CHASE1-domain containing sensor protein
MGKRLTVLSAALVLICTQTWAAPVCDRPADATALRTAALQQEMMVGALVCKAAGAYNGFVVSHQSALQASDRVLMAFFISANPRGGFDDYNLFKTELANNASLRAIHDMAFCARVAANFEAAAGRPLEQVLTSLPNPVGTGNVACRETAASEPPQVVAAK